MLRRILPAFALVVVTAQPAAADHPWPAPELHWPGSPEGTVMVSNRSGIPVADVAHAIAMWQPSSEYRLVDVGPVCPGWTPHRCVTIYTKYVAGDIQGQTWVRVPRPADNHILAADIHIEPGLSADLRRGLLVQELGHALGLGHRAEGSRSIMEAWFQCEWRPDRHDFEQLRRPH